MILTAGRAGETVAYAGPCPGSCTVCLCSDTGLALWVLPPRTPLPPKPACESTVNLLGFAASRTADDSVPLGRRRNELGRFAGSGGWYDLREKEVRQDDRAASFTP